MRRKLADQSRGFRMFQCFCLQGASSDLPVPQSLVAYNAGRWGLDARPHAWTLKSLRMISPFHYQRSINTLARRLSPFLTSQKSEIRNGLMKMQQTHAPNIIRLHDVTLWCWVHVCCIFIKPFLHDEIIAATQLATAGLARCAFFARFHKVTKLPTVQCRVTVFMQQRRNDGAETTTPDTCSL